MDLTAYRDSASEQRRTADLLRLMPVEGRSALDIGARDGHFSLLLADRFETVTAMDLVAPKISNPAVRCVQGNAAEMQFQDSSFDFVFCAEVLEHIPAALLQRTCREIERVAADRILIGVPYRQDIRVGRTTCYSCRKPNPPWGHVNSFDEQQIPKLFPHFTLDAVSFVGTNRSRTNWLSTAMMDFAGNPYGTYEQGEPCIHCGKRLVAPAPRSIPQKIATKLAFWSRKATESFTKPHGNWIHVLLKKIDFEYEIMSPAKSS